MKTLDEVIKNLEDGTEHLRAMLISRETWSDALHYLKMYRSDQIQWKVDRDDWQDKWESYIVARERHLDAVKELKRNDPLTWDELRQMEGKPVWYEVLDAKALPSLDPAGWGLACGTFTTWQGVESFSLVRIGVTYALPIAGYGRTWQVYRKEHHDH